MVMMMMMVMMVLMVVMMMIMVMMMVMMVIIDSDDRASGDGNDGYVAETLCDDDDGGGGGDESDGDDGYGKCWWWWWNMLNMCDKYIWVCLLVVIIMHADEGDILFLLQLHTLESRLPWLCRVHWWLGSAAAKLKSPTWSSLWLCQMPFCVNLH